MAGVEFIKVTPGKVRRVKITAPTRILGTHVNEGQIVEVEEAEAHNLIHAGKAQWFEVKAK